MPELLDGWMPWWMRVPLVRWVGQSCRSAGEPAGSRYREWGSSNKTASFGMQPPRVCRLQDGQSGLPIICSRGGCPCQYPARGSVVECGGPPQLCCGADVRFPLRSSTGSCVAQKESTRGRAHTKNPEGVSVGLPSLQNLPYCIDRVLINRVRVNAFDLLRVVVVETSVGIDRGDRSGLA